MQDAEWMRGGKNYLWTVDESAALVDAGWIRVRSRSVCGRIGWRVGLAVVMVVGGMGGVATSVIRIFRRMVGRTCWNLRIVLIGWRSRWGLVWLRCLVCLIV